MTKLTSKTARKLSRLGAQKGGTARANVLSPEERSEIARRAVQTRWRKAGKSTSEQKPDATRLGESDVEIDGIPYSLFQGKLQIGDLELECHVLNDMRRVFTQREMVRIISGGRDSGNLAAYLQSKVFADNPIDVGAIIPFTMPETQSVANGYEATTLVEICERYLDARERLRGEAQRRLGRQAEIVIRACAKVGIIALVDEATGFEKFRKKRDLQIKLQAFIAEDMQEWARMFPDDFWYELARLEGIKYSPRSRPLRWGKYVMAFVYDAVDGDVGTKLREINPEPHYKRNHHQWLKEFGRDQVHDQITKVVTIMKLCSDMRDFTAKFAQVFKKSTSQLEFNWFSA